MATLFSNSTLSRPLPRASPRHLRAASRFPLHIVVRAFPLQGVPMDTQHLRRCATIPFRPLHRARDEALFEKLDGFLHKESVVQQVLHQAVKLIFHVLFFPWALSECPSSASLPNVPGPVRSSSGIRPSSRAEPRRRIIAPLRSRRAPALNWQPHPLWPAARTRAWP